MNDKILITGGNGFIGSKLLERLAKDNEVESFDLADGEDIQNLWWVRNAVRGKTVVFHLAAVADLNWAAKHPIETMKINVEGTWNVAQACVEAGVKLYYASTCCIYGNQKLHPSDEETLPNPSEIYACTKLAGEYVITGFHHSFGLQYNHMRFATIYGKGVRPALATHIFMGQALRGEPITVHGDGSQTRTLTYIDDLVDAVVTLYESDKMNGAWNMTTEKPVSAYQMALDIKRITGSNSEITLVPQRVGQTFREELSAAKMLRETGWLAKTKWADGIKRMYGWFVSTEQTKNIYEIPSKEK